jgi:hypothetical protein
MQNKSFIHIFVTLTIFNGGKVQMTRGSWNGFFASLALPIITDIKSQVILL